MRVCQKNNKSNFDLNDACEHPILALNIYGKSTQDGTEQLHTTVYTATTERGLQRTADTDAGDDAESTGKRCAD